MGKTLWVVLAFVSPLHATPIAAIPVEGTATLGGSVLIVDLTGEPVNIHFSGDSSGQGSACEAGVPCLLRQTGVAGNPSDFVSIYGAYAGRAVETRLPASGVFDFSAMWTFGSDVMPGLLSVPLDVSGRLFLGPPGAPDTVDLRIAGRGTAGVLAERAPGNDLLEVRFGQAKFSGTLVETPEPSAAVLCFAGFAALLARKLGREYHSKARRTGKIAS
jgi:hypothetical protein